MIEEYFYKKGFNEDASGNFVLERDDIAIYIDRNSLIVNGFTKDNEAISKDEIKKYLTEIEIDKDFNIEDVEDSAIPSVKITPKANLVPINTEPIIDVKNIDKLYEIFTFIPGSDLEQGIEVEILTSIREVGEWIRRDSSGNIVQKRPKYGCLVKCTSGVVKRLEFGRNLYSALVAHYLTSKKTSKKIHIKREGKGLDTYYKIKSAGE